MFGAGAVLLNVQQIHQRFDGPPLSSIRGDMKHTDDPLPWSLFARPTEFYLNGNAVLHHFRSEKRKGIGVAPMRPNPLLVQRGHGANLLLRELGNGSPARRR